MTGATTISSSLNVANTGGANLSVNTTANVATMSTSTSTSTVNGASLTLTGGDTPSAVLSSFGGTAGGSTVAGPALTVDGAANSATLITATGQGLRVNGSTNTVLKGGTNSGTNSNNDKNRSSEELSDEFANHAQPPKKA